MQPKAGYKLHTKHVDGQGLIGVTVPRGCSAVVGWGRIPIQYQGEGTGAHHVQHSVWYCTIDFRRDIDILPSGGGGEGLLALATCASDETYTLTSALSGAGAWETNASCSY